MDRRDALKLLLGGAVLVGGGGLVRIVAPPRAIGGEPLTYYTTWPERIVVRNIPFYRQGPQYLVDQAGLALQYLNPTGCTDRRCTVSPHGIFVSLFVHAREPHNMPDLISANMTVARMTLDDYFDRPLPHIWNTQPIFWDEMPGYWGDGDLPEVV